VATTYQTVDTATAGGTTTITGTAPTGTTSGDTLWCVITMRASYTITAVPSGWTLYDSIDGGGGGDPTTLIYSHPYTSGTSWNWTRSSSSGGHTVSVIRVDSDDPETVTVYSENDTGSGTSHGATGVTTVAGDLLLAIYGQNHSSGAITWTYDGGGTEIVDTHHNSGTIRVGHSIYHSSPGAGATGTITGTSSATVSGVAILIALAQETSNNAAALYYFRQMADRNNRT